MVKLKVDTNKHEDLNLVFANHRKEDGISSEEKKYPQKIDSKSTKQRSIMASPVIKKLCRKKTKFGLAVVAKNS